MDSGNSKSTVVHFARDRADLAIVYLEENEDVDYNKRVIEGEGQECLLIRGDVGKTGRIWIKCSIKQGVELRYARPLKIN